MCHDTWVWICCLCFQTILSCCTLFSFNVGACHEKMKSLCRVRGLNRLIRNPCIPPAYQPKCTQQCFAALRWTSSHTFPAQALQKECKELMEENERMAVVMDEQEKELHMAGAKESNPQIKPTQTHPNTTRPGTFETWLDILDQKVLRWETP